MAICNVSDIPPSVTSHAVPNHTVQGVIRTNVQTSLTCPYLPAGLHQKLTLPSDSPALDWAAGVGFASAGGKVP